MADFDINSILSSLSQDDIENLKKTAAEIMGGSVDFANLQNQQSQQTTTKPTPEQNKSNLNIEDIMSAIGGNNNSFGLPDMALLNNLAPLLQAFNSHDERVDFINALRPLLSSERRKKADEAVKIVRLLSVLPLLKERGMM